MLNVFKKWLDNYLSDEEAITLLLILAGAFLIVLFLGGILAPVIASMIIAFLLQGVVVKLGRWMPHTLAVTLTFIVCVGGFTTLLVLTLPVIGKQVNTLAHELPRIAVKAESYLAALQHEMPTVFSDMQIDSWLNHIVQRAGTFGQTLVSISLETLPNIVAVLVYGVLIPILVFFFLKDKDQLLGWFARFLPRSRPLMTSIWQEMNLQVANYVRGKAVEVLIVGVTTYVAFIFLGQNYALLLGVLVGLSVIVPYIGAAVVTLPVALMSFFQFGWADGFFYVMLAYGIIQFIDGNVLVPLLFSEAVNLHPVAIIIAVLVFGGIWGLWGVFFAIPLATLVKALIEAWPTGNTLKNLDQEGN
ncbi:Putative transport protein [BD1-7 clade bacterium]|uniref:Transport protein n=1 Tax=BD1-7 clade bacterium TaxID=2029982 RepID=A0A5S9MWS8_9GAMM|nr:Putative transport protein [BD1-7 clade bacterium]